MVEFPDLDLIKDKPVWVVKSAQRYHRKIIRFNPAIRVDSSLKQLKYKVLYYPSRKYWFMNFFNKKYILVFTFR